MIEVNLRSFLSEFNGSKFVVYSTLLSFFVLLALKLDGLITINYFFVFLPIWIGEFVVFVGFLVGFISFIICPPSRTDIVSRNNFFAMCFCTLEHLLLLMFELLCYCKLANLNKQDAELSWLLVFSPLYVECFMAMIISVWCIRHDRTFEFEMFFSINVVQFVFLAFKLDRTLHWNWVIIFVPVWVIFALFFIGTFYSLIISFFLSRSVHSFHHGNRRSHVFSVISHFLLSVPLLAFFILLSGKLDALEYWLRYRFSASRMPYVVVGMPLYVALSFLLVLSFGSKSGNTWWFAMRKPFCNFVFDVFPCLQQYANISYRFGGSGTTASDSAPTSFGARNSQYNAERARMLRCDSSGNTEDLLPSNSMASSFPRHTPYAAHSIELPD